MHFDDIGVEKNDINLSCLTLVRFKLIVSLVSHKSIKYPMRRLRLLYNQNVIKNVPNDCKPKISRRVKLNWRQHSKFYYLWSQR